MISILDYKCGNIGSIKNMLRRVGFDQTIVTSSPEEIANSAALILPGVGSFDSGMTNLSNLGMVDILNDFVINKGKPALGVCLGMQLLFDGSDEGKSPGLGWIPGRCKKFSQDKANIRVPHMGWNSVEVTEGSRMFANQFDNPSFYFVHSYHAVCEDESHVSGWTTHGYRFASAVERDNIWGAQFHPEKSHKFGMKLMKAFVEHAGLC